MAFTRLLIWLVLCAFVLLRYQSTQQPLHTAQYDDGWVFDDSDPVLYPKLSFFIQSDLDTTQIDNLMQWWYNSNLAWEIVSNDIAQDRLDKICEYYEDICLKMIFESPYTLEQKYTFTLHVAFLITQVDKHILLWSTFPLRTSLSTVKFLKSPEWRRGKASSANIILNTQLMRDRVNFNEVLVHELGHVIDLSVLHDSAGKKNTQFKEFGKAKFGNDDPSLRFYQTSRHTDQVAHNTDFVTHYGGSNPFEGFAELFNARVNHHAPLLKLAKQNDRIKQKYLLMREIFGTRHINLDIETYRTMPLQQKPYDSTLREETLAPF